MRRNLLSFLPFFMALGATASPLCTSGTLANYQSLSAGCTVGNVTFGSFNFTAAGSVVVTADQIQVQVVYDGTNQGLSFNGPFHVGEGLSMDALISYLMSASSLTGATLTVGNPQAKGSGTLASVFESFCSGVLSFTGTCSGTTQSLNAFASSGGTVPTDTLTFAAGTTTVAVVKNVILNGGAAGSGSGGASVASVVNTVTSGGGGAGPGGSPVPEPDTLVMMLGAGLVAASLAVRRARIRR